jgi:putative endonuclease
MDHRQELGRVGEDLAVAALVERGYAIVARRYRTERGEIDIIAEDGSTLVFVEVRARADGECGLAAESVTESKRRKVSRMAAQYLAFNHVADRPCRFDVVAIDGALDQAPTVTVYPNAFDASGIG